MHSQQSRKFIINAQLHKMKYIVFGWRYPTGVQSASCTVSPHVASVSKQKYFSLLRLMASNLVSNMISESAAKNPPHLTTTQELHQPPVFVSAITAVNYLFFLCLARKVPLRCDISSPPGSPGQSSGPVRCDKAHWLQMCYCSWWKCSACGHIFYCTAMTDK